MNNNELKFRKAVKYAKETEGEESCCFSGAVYDAYLRLRPLHSKKFTQLYCHNKLKHALHKTRETLVREVTELGGQMPTIRARDLPRINREMGEQNSERGRAV